MARADYIHVARVQQHTTRRREILQSHPEVRELAGTSASSAAWVVALVAAQLGLAALVGDSRWYIWLPVAYIVGATIDHALWVLIHECTHSLVFRRPALNKVTAIVANLPLVFPAAASFTRFHLLHHQHLGELDYDADLPGPVESRVIRTSMLKAAWLAAFGAVQGLVRTHRLKKVAFFDRWIVANIVVQLSTVAALYLWLGIGPLDVPDRVVDCRHRASSARRAMDSGALRLRGRSGNVFLLRAAQPCVLQHGVPQRAS